MEDPTNQDVPLPTVVVDINDDPDLFIQFELNELERRTEVIEQRDSIPTSDARLIAQRLLSNEMASGKLTCPTDKHTYCIYYVREHSPDELRVVYAVIDGKLFDWPVVTNWLANILEHHFDALCKHVVSFHDINDPHYR